MLVRCSFMTSPSESKALLSLQPPSIWKVEEKPQPVLRDPPCPRLSAQTLHQLQLQSCIILFSTYHILKLWVKLQKKKIVAERQL